MRWPRWLGITLAAAVGLELVYLLLANWFVNARLAQNGVRADGVHTLYPGDLRASQVELSAAEGGARVRMTGVTGHLRWRSVVTGSLELSWLEASRLQVELSDLAKCLRALREQPARTPDTLPASLLGRTRSTQSIVIDRFEANIGVLKIATFTLDGQGSLLLRGLVFPGVSGMRALVNAQRLTLKRGGGAPGATFSGYVDLTLDPQARVRSPPQGSADSPRVRAALRGDVHDLRALLGFGPALRLQGLEFDVDFGAIGTASRPNSISLRIASTELMPGSNRESDDRSRQRGALIMRGKLGYESETSTERLHTLELSGSGDDASLLFDLLEAPRAVRWMFEELNGSSYRFTLYCVFTSTELRIERVTIDAGHTSARAMLRLGTDKAEPEGAVLFERGALRMGILLNRGEERLVQSPPPDWLEGVNLRTSPAPE